MNIFKVRVRDHGLYSDVLYVMGRKMSDVVTKIEKKFKNDPDTKTVFICEVEMLGPLET